jgi:hypothetical protein
MADGDLLISVVSGSLVDLSRERCERIRRRAAGARGEGIRR